MGATIAVGGGTSGVAASAHAGCERFRQTDPILTKQTRRALAKELGFPDVSGVIPEARWMRAMLFERLVHDQAFISELMTLGIGELGLARPTAVRHVECRRSPRQTVRALDAAHSAARDSGIATMLTGAVVPMSGFEGTAATPVLPDFAVVARRESPGGAGSWLIAGDAKDYERIRSRIEDSRLLKGFLQVALGAESFDAWSQIPNGMQVHPSGFLAVPRSAYLRPTVVVEELDDHRQEVRGRLAQRVAMSRGPVASDSGDGASALEGGSTSGDPGAVRHIRAEFDPARCVTCSLFGFCRNELRESVDPSDVLVEIGIPRPHRPAGLPLIGDRRAVTALPEREALSIVATQTGFGQWTRALRVDPVGSPSTVNVVLVKSDSAALGVNGVAVQLVGSEGPEEWHTLIFAEPRTPETRANLLGLVGDALDDAMGQAGTARPVHVCVPDRATGDILATMADSAAGVEISRLSWMRDLEQGRTPVTFDGKEATMPEPLADRARLAISFLLDEDRARAFSLRHPVVAVQEALARHLVPGGPWSDAGRLDYLVAWGEATGPLAHRIVSDAVSDDVHAPGARMTTTRSNALHSAEQAKDWAVYRKLVLDELAFRITTMDRAAAVLARLPLSRLREVHEAIELDAQTVWRRRLAFHASDLVRFSLTSRRWRDDLVDPLQQDGDCARVLAAMLDTGAALDLARDAGNRAYFEAEVTAVDPPVLSSHARAITDGMELIALHVDDSPEVERPDIALTPKKGAFAFKNVLAGPVEATDDPLRWTWQPASPRTLKVGDRLVVADVDEIGETKFKGNQFNLKRPTPDTELAPKVSCQPGDYENDPAGHRWCCRSHEAAAAERADWFAERRAKGEMNPEVWPPIIDLERFVVPGDEDLGDDDVVPLQPDGATLDDIE